MVMASHAQEELQKMNDVYCVILAGGHGERLWPLSTIKKPKQLLTIDGKKTLLEQAIGRVSSLISQDHIWVSTTTYYADLIKKEVGNYIGNVFTEPSLRNTAPAILLTCLELQMLNPNAIVFFAPADSFIPEDDTDLFVSYLKKARDFVVDHDCITLFGVKPTYPATGYGYIEVGTIETSVPISVTSFHEKPSADIAQFYLDSGAMLWNIGIFCGKASVFIAEFKKHAPDIYDSISSYVNGNMQYEDVRSCSIDYAVMEKSDRIFVLPVDFSWCDVGNISIFLDLKNKHTELKDNVIAINANNNVVDVPDKLVTLIGVDDLCVVQENDVLLIAKKDKAEHVKAAVEQLKKSKRNDYL